MDRAQLSPWSDCLAGLAFGFAFPTRGHVAARRENLLLVGLARFDQFQGDDRHRLERVVSTLGSGTGEEGRLRDLRREYQRLFELPRPVVSPYRSDYSHDRAEAGSSAAQVLERYRELGFTISRSYRDLPDHFALQLELVARLGSLESQRRCKAGNTRAFLEDHLLPWATSFLQRVRSEARDPFYLELAEISEGVLCREQGVA